MTGLIKKYMAVMLAFAVSATPLNLFGGARIGFSEAYAASMEAEAQNITAYEDEDLNGAGEEQDSAKRAEEILKKMPLKRKVEQMLMPTFRYKPGEDGKSQDMDVLTAEAIKVLSEHNFGGVIIFAENARGTKKTAEFVNSLQANNAKTVSEPGIPLFIAIDQEGGYITRLGTGTGTCGNMALGAAGSKEYAKENGSIIGKELSALGINVDFAPVMDVNNNPGNPVIGVRSFSSDPAKVSELGSSMIEGLHSQNVITALKHFPGHGDTDTDSHTGLPSINKTKEELEKCELIPFKAGIKAGADMIMTAHIVYPKIVKETHVSANGTEISLPATLSKTIIKDMLRKEMGYDGVVVTDAMEMDAISKYFGAEDAAKYAINADVDLLLIPFDTSTTEALNKVDDYVNMICGLVSNNKIPVSEIDDSVMRILKLKAERGILDNKDEIDADAAVKIVGSKANHDKEWEITTHAMTLLKNDSDLLPLDTARAPLKDKKIVIFAVNEGEANAANYAINRLKEEGKIPKDKEIPVKVYSEKKLDAFSSELEGVDYAVALSKMNSVKWMDPGDADSAKESRFLDGLIAAMHKKGGNVIIISDQLPYDAARLKQADAILAAYSSKQMSKLPDWSKAENALYGPNIPVAVYTVFGGSSPTGKLPVDIPDVDDKYQFSKDILYPMGTGLEYKGAPNIIKMDGTFTAADGTVITYPKSLPFVGANWSKYMKGMSGFFLVNGKAATIKKIRLKMKANKTGKAVVKNIKFTDGYELKNPDIEIDIVPYEINSHNADLCLDTTKMKKTKKGLVKGIKLNFSDLKTPEGTEIKVKGKKIPTKLAVYKEDNGEKQIEFLEPYVGTFYVVNGLE